MKLDKWVLLAGAITLIIIGCIVRYCLKEEIGTFAAGIALLVLFFAID